MLIPQSGISMTGRETFIPIGGPKAHLTLGITFKGTFRSLLA
jgi:hypothetical protein